MPLPDSHARQSPSLAGPEASGPVALPAGLPWAEAPGAAGAATVVAVAAAAARPGASPRAPAGAWWLTHGTGLGRRPPAAAATPPIDTAAASRAAALTPRSLRGMRALRGMVGGQGRSSAAKRLTAAASPASSSGVDGPAALASSLATAA
jgi:hypothetical protein